MQCQVFSCRWFYLFLFLCSEVIRTIPNASHLWVRGLRSKNIFQSWGVLTKSMLLFYDLHKVSNCRDLGQEFFGTFTCNCDQWGSCFKEISQVTNVPRLLEKPRKADSYGHTTGQQRASDICTNVFRLTCVWKWYKRSFLFQFPLWLFCKDLPKVLTLISLQREWNWLLKYSICVDVINFTQILCKFNCCNCFQ